MNPTSWLHSVQIKGSTIDPCKVGLPLRMTYGRSDVFSQPDAPTCSFTWLGDTVPGVVGDMVQVFLTLQGSGPTWIYDAPANYLYDSSEYVWDNTWVLGVGPRFTGTIAGIKAVERLGEIVAWEVSCIGFQASLGALPPLTLTRPQETDVARMQAIITATGTSLGFTVHGTSTLQLAADTIDKQGPMEAIHAVCESAAGLFWQGTDGSLHYGTANHRQKQPEGVLPCDVIYDGIEWDNNRDRIINHVTVKYGVDGSLETTQQDTDSIGQPWYLRHADANTTLAAKADADQLANLILARRAWPFWVMPGVMVPISEATRPEQNVVVNLDVSDIVLVPVDHTPLPTPALGWVPWVVEGWVEEAGSGGRTEIQLALADAARWVETRFRTWNEAKAFTWAQEASGSWLDALIWEAVA